ncbi:ABC transporter substrate-binding protein [Corynebacterium sanguinis]|uniref:ABC transporter substrate-binding protein n=1 Tax=Corynebacterium sanguinis TaxID=2594913 RepID=UPI001185BB20|nr:ABC transporter substrate-binding protein [Corynebacterium sanguinis]MCT1412104.1 ABC transporter substrate-binding protein [Corynebacterium sanguinis]MCT1444970.1 ABC transporter substrate-binding protein [Corynebacterium sanguinis]MCT1492457.1 ABC transporter substrate-binding protein [Corynebacterium sanguinis]MCT1500065.1 ABC transporter substrate-binding protein [Corynebacterium sanguinis]MCT2247711.1 ABC transporter substrate-binding protein [Corynebacterium sanguinis]
MRKSYSFAAVVGSALLLTSCVTNTEGGNPEGWEPVEVEAVPEIAAMVPERVAADGKLSVGTNPPFAPFEFKDSTGNLIGVELDLGQALAQVMGLEFDPQEMDFSMILPAVQAGSLDAGMSGFTDTEERRESYDFVNFLYAGIQWAQQPGNDVDPANPCGLTVAVQRTTVSETDDVRPKSDACVTEGDDPITVLSFDTSDNAALAALTGRADAFSADSPVTAWAVERSDGDLELVGDMFDAAPYGIAVNKGSELGPALAAAMQHLIDTGEYARILGQWNIDSGLLDEALINEQPQQGAAQ